MKKTFLKTAVASSLLLLAALFLQNCAKKNLAGMAVTISSVTPRTGGTGTLVTITGSGFVADTTQESVSLGLIKAPIVAANSTQIVISVPLNRDSATLDSVPILLVVQGALANGGYFTYNINNTNVQDVSTFAGSGTPGSADGIGAAATFNNPENAVFDAGGNMYVADYGNNEIRKITPAGVVSTFAGSTTKGYRDGPALQALFAGPSGLAFDNQGNLYVSDELNNRIRKIDQSGNVSTIAGSGVAALHDANGTSASFDRPIGLGYDVNSNLLVVADSRNNVIRAVNLASLDVNTLAGAINGPNNPGSADDTSSYTATFATFNSPRGIALYSYMANDTEKLFIYVADYGNNKIREVVSIGNFPSNSLVTTYTLAGNANNQPGFSNGNNNVAFFGPNSLCLGFMPSTYGSGNGNQVMFVGDASNNAIRYTPDAEKSLIIGSYMNFQTLAGSGIPGFANGSYTSALFKFPDGVAFNPVDGNLYVIEFGNNDIRKVLIH